MTDVTVIEMMRETRYWYARGGKKVLIRSMEPSYLENVMDLLDRKAETLALRYALRSGWQFNVMNPEELSDGVYSTYCHEVYLPIDHPTKWLHQTPLYRALNSAYELKVPGYRA